MTDGVFLPFIFTHRRFFLAACDVPSLEEKFNVDQYSDLVTVTKPVIYISIGEIINTHTVSLHSTPAHQWTMAGQSPKRGRALSDLFVFSLINPKQTHTTADT